MLIQPVSLIYLLIGLTFIVVGGLISAGIVPPKAGSQLTARLYYCFGIVYFLLFLAGYNKGKGNYLDITHYPYVVYVLLVFFSLGFRTLPSYAGFISHQFNLEKISKKLSNYGIILTIGVAILTPYVFSNPMRPLGIVAGLTGALILLQCIFCLRIVQLNARRVVNFYADCEQVSLRWLAWTILLFIGLAGNLMIAPWLRPYLDSKGFYGRSAFTEANPIGVIAVILFGFLAYKMLGQNQIDRDVLELADPIQGESTISDSFDTKSRENDVVPAGLVDSERISHAPPSISIDPHTMDQYWQKITSVMESSRPYLVHGFSVSQLAELTSIKRYLLSITINAKSGLVFQEFVNNYRVGHAIAMLEDAKSSTAPIKAIMVESGFRSSSVFHANFRRVTGISPLKFREKAMKAN
jgi:AraC-like DNA-binding protein